MLVYGICAGPTGKFDRIASPSIEKIRKMDDQVLPLFGQPSIAVAYNRILEQACQIDDLDGVILLHDDIEVLDLQLDKKIKATFSDESVGVVGVVGASGVQSLEWWAYETRGRVKEDRAGVIDFGGGDHAVDMVDGIFMGISPWAARHLRFDEGYPGFHGYDGDFCFTVRAHGRTVVVREIDVVHRSQGGYGDKAAFDAADARFQHKWRLEPPPPPPRIRRLIARAPLRGLRRRRSDS